jgi:hypothetical protein
VCNCNLEKFGLRVQDLETKIFYASKVAHLGSLNLRSAPDLNKNIFWDESPPERENHLGMNASLTWGEVVMRVDALLLLDEKLSQRLKQAGIFAVDVPVGTGNFALQYQVDRALKKNKNWVAFQFRYPIADFEPETLLLKGVGNKDFWLKLAIKYLASQNWSLGLEWHKVEGDGEGFGPQFAPRQVGNAQLAYTF